MSPTKTAKSSKTDGKPQKEQSSSRLIDARIKEFADWRGKTLKRLRTLIRQADPHIVEE